MTEQWGIFEATFDAPIAQARFWQGEQSITVAGFWDGGNDYRVRFMPPAQGTWHYETDTGKQGTFEVGAPGAGNHGMVRVAHTFHFAYDDGTPYRQLGTTCYVWNHQSVELQAQTLQTLAASPFNKIRFCVFPKRYAFNQNEPLLYPFAGTPPRNWDFTQFNPAFFRNLEALIVALGKLGIEADIILFHPYDEGHWGFDRMTAEADDAYLRYVVTRLSVYRNVWWSLANEFDFMDEKRDADWDRFIQIVKDSDPYGHLTSIHNGTRIYNHNDPRLTHASIQNGSAVEEAGRAVLYRDAYRKPVVFDEVKYEGDIPQRWGNITGAELVHRFWEGTIAGSYVGHGETFLHPEDILWWSKGGILHGESPTRLAFLRTVLEDSPPEGIEPMDKWQDPRLAGRAGRYYLHYFGNESPTVWRFALPKSGLADGIRFTVEVLDTWNCTITPVEGVFTAKRLDNYTFVDAEERTVPLSGQPRLALRIKRIDV